MNNEECIIKRLQEIFKNLNRDINLLTEECININRLVLLAKPFKNSNMPLYFCANNIALACKLNWSI